MPGALFATKGSLRESPRSYRQQEDLPSLIVSYDLDDIAQDFRLQDLEVFCLQSGQRKSVLVGDRHHRGADGEDIFFRRNDRVGGGGRLPLQAQEGRQAYDYES